MMDKYRGDLSTTDRLAYIVAVQRLLTAPSQLPAGQFLGTYSRYEDFVVTHMQQTLTVHGTVSYLLAWKLYEC